MTISTRQQYKKNIPEYTESNPVIQNQKVINQNRFKKTKKMVMENAGKGR